MSFDSLLRTFLERPAYLRLFTAFTVALFLSCAARVSDAQPHAARTTARGPSVERTMGAPATANAAPG